MKTTPFHFISQSFFFLAIFSFNTSLVLGQSPLITWQRSFGGSESDEPSAIIQSRDSGVVIVGHTFSTDGDITSNGGEADAWIVKLRADGTLDWQITIGGNIDDYAYAITQTHNGDYLVVGKTNSEAGLLSASIGLYDGWIARLNEDGDIIWVKTFGAPGNDSFNAVFECENGDIAIAGSVSRGATGDQSHTDFLLLKTTSSGKILQAKAYGGSGTEVLTSALHLPDGNFMLCGYASSKDGDLKEHFGKNDVWLVKVDENGIMCWNKIIGKPDGESVARCSATDDGGFLVSGFRPFIKSDVNPLKAEVANHALVAKFSSNGDEEWEYELPRQYHAKYEELNCFETIEGGYFIGGLVQNKHDVDKNNHLHVFAIELDKNRVIGWNESVETARKNFKIAFSQSLDGNFILASNRFCFSSNNCPKRGLDDYSVAKIIPSAEVSLFK